MNDQNTADKQAAKPNAQDIPWDTLYAVMRVANSGAAKYGSMDWRKKNGDPSITLNKIFRHWTALMRGEVFDAESGEHHAAHIAMCALILLDINAVPMSADYIAEKLQQYREST